MSVLKIRRTQSKAEYVSLAGEIHTETLQFLTRLSTRYARLLADSVIKLASEVVVNAEKAQNIFPSDEIRKQLRETHFLEARASLSALDTQLADCYEVMMLNPQGCFSPTPKGKLISSADAIQKLDHMANSLGEKIDKETSLLTNVMKSDKKR